MGLKSVITAILVSACILPSFAITKSGNTANHDEHQRKFYVRGSLLAPINLHFKSDDKQYLSNFRVGGNVAAGLEFHRLFAGELELMRLRFPISFQDFTPGDNRKMTAWVGFANLLFRPHLETIANRIRPFLGIGLGYTKKQVSRSRNNIGIYPPEMSGSKSSKFAYQVLLGVEWMVRSNLSVLLDARWINLGKTPVVYTSTVKANYSSHLQAFTVGIKLKF